MLSLLNRLLGIPDEDRDNLFIGVFSDEDDVLHATEECRKADFNFYDVFTPYAVHGLDRAMGLPFSKVTWVTFLCGALGTTIAISGMTYISAWDWPLNIGGKPPFPFPAFVPIMFELTVLIGGVCTMLGLFAMCGIFPGKKARLFHPRVTDDRFVIVLEVDEDFDEAKCREIFGRHHVEEMKEVDPDYEVEPDQLEEMPPRPMHVEVSTPSEPAEEAKPAEEEKKPHSSDEASAKDEGGEA
ncbi:MAG: DUF3341 domain-containing protein [Planctomycetes bacterium]|nr:DUF3341 domain-containing protein [Planctomycetota bacterium]